MQLRDEAWAALERTKPQLPEMFQGREKELLETVCMGLPAEKVDGFTKLFKSMSKPAMEQFMASPQAQAEEANSQQAQAAARSGSGMTWRGRLAGQKLIRSGRIRFRPAVRVDIILFIYRIEYNRM